MNHRVIMTFENRFRAKVGRKKKIIIPEDSYLKSMFYENVGADLLPSSAYRTFWTIQKHLRAPTYRIGKMCTYKLKLTTVININNDKQPTYILEINTVIQFVSIMFDLRETITLWFMLRF
jgi:hypothetical protein